MLQKLEGFAPSFPIAAPQVVVHPAHVQRSTTVPSPLVARLLPAKLIADLDFCEKFKVSHCARYLISARSFVVY